MPAACGRPHCSTDLNQETRMTQSPDLLKVREVAKSYGPVVALRSADLSVAPGEIHALLGANGAGKSTLVKILSGVLRRDSGTIAVGGKQVCFGNPVEALRAGIA